MNDCPQTYIVIIIVGSGLLGGLTNYLMLYDKNLTTREQWIKAFASVLLSLCAALTVPLFLQILSNNLLDSLTFKNGLIFTGFCVIASFFSKRFLEDVYSKLEKLDKKIDNTREETKDKVESVTQKTDQVIKKVDDLEESIESIEDGELPTGIKETIKENRDITLDDTEIEAIIRSLLSEKFSLRTHEGIAKQTNVQAEKIKSLLEFLTDRGLAEKKVSSQGRDLWRILKYPIKIYSASYGVRGKTVDVTNKIKDLVAQGIYEGSVSPGFFGVEDPAYGTPKVLKIHCRIYGKERELTFGDGHSFKIA